MWSQMDRQVTHWLDSFGDVILHHQHYMDPHGESILVTDNRSAWFLLNLMCLFIFSGVTKSSPRNKWSGSSLTWDCNWACFCHVLGIICITTVETSVDIWVWQTFQLHKSLEPHAACVSKGESVWQPASPHAHLSIAKYVFFISLLCS